MPHDHRAVQDLYPENLSHCYGCGRLNPDGLKIKTHWEGAETVTRYLPKPCHKAIPGFVYGGLLASLIDCHGTGTAAAAAARAQGRTLDSLPPLRFVTAWLKADYLKPTPMGVMLEIRGKPKEVKGRKVVVEATLFANGVATVRGEIVAVQMPETFLPET
jgi:acyl-coenzyme A thioesterase PaaI-like protein